MRIIALVNNPCIVDARVTRSAEAAAEVGYLVQVLCHWSPTAPEEESLNGVEYRRIPVRRRQKWQKLQAGSAPQTTASGATGSTHRSGAARPKRRSPVDWLKLCIGLLRRSAQFAKGNTIKLGRYILSGNSILFVKELIDHTNAYSDIACEFRPDIVHSHDLFTLLAGARIAKKTGAKLVYDSHELEVGRNGNFSRFSRLVRGWAERILIGRTDAVITVSDSIADFLSDRYRIERPTVVHNSPAVSRTNGSGTDVRTQIGLAPDTPLALYIGGITINRGVENCVRALAHMPSLHLACIGKRYKPVEETMLSDAERLGVSERLHLIDPVAHDQVTSFVRTGDLSLIPIQDVCLSYRFCFPNKLLESLLAGLPVVVASLVELERMIERTGAGVVIDQTDPKDIANGVRLVIENSGNYQMKPEDIEGLRQEYGWSAQKVKLQNIYQRLGEDGVPSIVS